MQLVESHIIKPNNPFYKEIDELCFKSKNLYNSCLYAVRQEYINNGNNILFELHNRFKDSEQYKDLPAKVSSTILNTVQLNFKAFFAGLKAYQANPSKFKGRPKLPKYLDSVDGRFFVSYTNQAISKKIFKKSGKIKLSKANIEFNTRLTEFTQIDCVRLIPHNGYYTIEVVYTVPDKPKSEDNKRYASIDLGVNNLATVTTNTGTNPYVINGKPLKSMNQYYNKRLAYYKSILDTRNNKKKSNKINKLNLKRKNKVDNYLHNASKIIVDNLLDNNINTLVIGKNKQWKTDVNLGSANNQKFVQIPHSRFIDMLTYKCEREGINIILTEESYTSKCSFLDGETIKKHEQYKGKRIYRGLFKSANGALINADVNGSYNILRKALPEAFADGIEGVGVHPIIVKITN